MPLHRTGVNTYAVRAITGRHHGGAANTANAMFGRYEKAPQWRKRGRFPTKRSKSDIGIVSNRFTAAVSQSSDDATQQTDDSVALADSGLQGSTANDHIGIRFQNVVIPQGATILAARIVSVIDDGSKNDAEGNWKCHDADNAGTFTTTSNDIDSRARTTASVSWTTNDLGSLGSVIETPDLSACVQEVIDRGGWASGNALVFIYDHLSTDSLRVASFDHTTSDEPRLLIEWVPTPTAGATNAPAGDPVASGIADQAEVTVAPNAGAAASTGTALQPTVVTGTLAPAELAAATGTADQASVTVAPESGAASSTGTADQPEATVGAKPNTPEAIGVANQATVETAAFTNAPAGLATATGTAGQPEITISPNAGVGLAAGVANQLASRVEPKPSGPTAAGTALQATVDIEALAFAANAAATAEASPAKADLDIKATSAIAVGEAFPVFGLTGNPLGAGYPLLVDDDDDAVTVSDHDSVTVTESGQGLIFLENQDALEVSS